jgi:hypothetical protein
MPRKPMTEEQKQALRERLAKARAAKQAKNEEKETAPTPTDHGSTDPTVAELTKQVEELKALVANQQTSNPQTDLISALQAMAGINGAQISRGRVVGTTEKHSTDLTRYDDPRERLRKEPRLARIAFDTNYELEFDVGVTQYETKDGISLKEPKFHLKLNQIILDEDGEPTNRRMGKAQMIFFEDPATAMEVANRLGLPVDETNETAFLNEMRYMRMREWLFECFWPPKPNTDKGNQTEMVINGQVVQTWEVSTEGNARIPFDKLSNKLRA